MNEDLKSMGVDDMEFRLNENDELELVWKSDSESHKAGDGVNPEELSGEMAKFSNLLNNGGATIKLVNNEFNLNKAGYPSEDVGVSMAQKFADGTIYVNMEALREYRQRLPDAAKGTIYSKNDPLNTVTQLYHEFVEFDAGKRLRAAHPDMDKQEVFNKAHAEACAAENAMRAEHKLARLVRDPRQTGWKKVTNEQVPDLPASLALKLEGESRTLWISHDSKGAVYRVQVWPPAK